MTSVLIEWQANWQQTCQAQRAGQVGQDANPNQHYCYRVNYVIGFGIGTTSLRRGLKRDPVRNRGLFAILFWCMARAAEASCLDSLAEHRSQIESDYLKSDDLPFDTELRAGFSGFSYFAGDIAYCVEASFQPSQDSKVFAMPSFNGTTLPFRKYGAFHFQLAGAPRTLTAYQRIDLPKGQGQWVLIPFRDATTGHETYGGGRYLEMESPLPARTTLDFNRAFNPLCAYKSTFTCPIPPAENWLKIRVAAGEKTYAGNH